MKLYKTTIQSKTDRNIDIKRDYVEKGMTLRQIGAKYKLSHQTIADAMGKLTEDNKAEHLKNRHKNIYLRLSTV